MRVGVDATGWANRRGYGRFARNAVRRLIEDDDDPSTKYVLYVDDTFTHEDELPEAAEVRRVRQRRAPTEAAAADSSRGVADVLRMTLAVRRDELSVFLFPSLQTYFPVSRVPTLVGIHDAITTELPSLTVPTMRSRLFWRAKERHAIRRASRIFTVSEAARDSIASSLGVPRGRLAVVPEAPDPLFRPRSAAEVAAERTAVGLPAAVPYLLYAGGISPHKDVETLVDALGRLDSTCRPKLVIVGELETETYVSAAGSVRARIAATGLDADVVLPGFVSDDALAALYTGAAAVVNPSRAEGFGLPAVEAAACGAALVLSDLPAHRESLGENALFFPPGDADALAAALRSVLAEPDAARARADLAREAVARMTWQATGARLRELLVEASR